MTPTSGSLETNRAFLALPQDTDICIEPGTTRRFARGSRSNPQDVPGESELGCTPAFTGSCSNLGSTSARPASASTWCAAANRPRGPGASSWRFTCSSWSPSISLPCRPFVSKFLYVFLVLAHDRRRIVHCNVTAHRPRSGRGSNCERPFPSTNCRATCCGTAMLSSAMPSRDRCETWASRKCCAPLDPPGSGPTSSG